ncbi:MAG: hypothetical protein ACR2G2_01720 [Pseudonocardia sp.]
MPDDLEREIAAAFARLSSAAEAAAALVPGYLDHLHARHQRERDELE